MGGDVILFSPIASQIEQVRERVNLAALTLDELLSEVVVGQFVILASLPQHQYLQIERADIGFIANLRLKLTQAKQSGVHRLTSPDQTYDLEIRVEGERCRLRDLAQTSQPEIAVRTTAFQKSVYECGAGTYHMLRMILPELSARQDIEQLRSVLGVAKHR